MNKPGATMAKAQQKADRAADDWWQADRIERYLPTLGRQREEAARRLAELDELIADEKAAVLKLRRSADQWGEGRKGADEDARSSAA